MRGDEVMTNLAPSHCLDDGLNTAARRCFVVMMRRARSRDMRAVLDSLHGKTATLPKWPAVMFAFVGFFEQCPPTVQNWIAHGDEETNRVRLACAMGIESLWHPAGHGFIHEMMQEPLGLHDDELATMKAFTLTRETALPEL